MDYTDLTPEQKAKARACKTPEELIALAREEGVELTDTELEAVSGGSWSDGCPKFVCESKDPGYGGASGSW